MKRLSERLLILLGMLTSLLAAQSDTHVSWSYPSNLIGAPGQAMSIDTVLCSPASNGSCGNITGSVALAFQVSGQSVLFGTGLQERSGVLFTPPTVSFPSFAGTAAPEWNAWLHGYNPDGERHVLLHGNPAVALPDDLRIRFDVVVPQQARDGDIYLIEISDDAPGPGTMYTVDADLNRYDLVPANFRIEVRVRAPTCDADGDGTIGNDDKLYARDAIVGLAECTFGGLAAEPNLCTIDDAVALVQLVSAHLDGDAAACAL